MTKKIDVIGVCLDKGASMEGCRFAPDAFREAGLIDALKQLNLAVNDCGNITLSIEYKDSCGCCCGCDVDTANGKKLKNLKAVNDINEKLYKMAENSHSAQNFPLVIGGDHSLAVASILATQKHSSVGVIWIDAHGDYNNAQSSPSGNIHGMSLSALSGNGPEEIVQFKENQPFVSPKNCVLIGARDLDSEEKKRIESAGVTVFGMDEIQKEGIESVIKKASQIALNGTDGIYLSFDADGIDPNEAVGVGTPCENGLTLDEASVACRYLHSTNKLKGVEFVELNPLKDQDNSTAKALIKLICCTFGG